MTVLFIFQASVDASLTVGVNMRNQLFLLCIYSMVVPGMGTKTGCVYSSGPVYIVPLELDLLISLLIQLQSKTSSYRFVWMAWNGWNMKCNFNAFLCLPFASVIFLNHLCKGLAKSFMHFKMSDALCKCHPGVACFKTEALQCKQSTTTAPRGSLVCESTALIFEVYFLFSISYTYPTLLYHFKGFFEQKNLHACVLEFLFFYHACCYWWGPDHNPGRFPALHLSFKPP